MKYFSMFSGIGGFEYGIQRAIDKNREQEPVGQGSIGERIQRQGNIPDNNGSRLQSNTEQGHRLLNGVCVGYSEIDKYAIKVYERNFNGHKNYGDATKINPEELPDFDLLVGGFPCQAFSIAGKRRGFDDTRGTLFFDIARILAEKKPKHLVLENVKGLLSHDQGRTFQTILGVLADLGYRVEWQVLNSKDFGVPQNRERIIIVGHLGGEPRRKVFPITNGSKSHLKYSEGVISSREKWLEDGNNNSRNFSQGQRIYSTEGISQTLAGQAGGQGGKTGLYEIADTRIRRLTPLECERLQGFPDNWTALGVGDEPISDTQRYKMCGNAVTTNVIQAVMEKLCVGLIK